MFRAHPIIDRLNGLVRDDNGHGDDPKLLHFGCTTDIGAKRVGNDVVVVLTAFAINGKTHASVQVQDTNRTSDHVRLKMSDAFAASRYWGITTVVPSSSTCTWSLAWCVGPVWVLLVWYIQVVDRRSQGEIHADVGLEGLDVEITRATRMLG